MRITLFAVLLLLFSSHSKGQVTCCPYLYGIQIMPLNPTTNDTIKIITNTACPGLGNEVSYQHTIINDTIYISGCFYSGPLTAIQTYNDTTILPPLSSGNYVIQYKGYISLDTSVCTYTDSNSLNQNFIVGIPETLDFIKQSNSIHIIPNLISHSVRVHSGELNSEVSIYNALGQIQEKRKFNIEDQINLNTYSSGLYFISLQIKDFIQTFKIVKP